MDTTGHHHPLNHTYTYNNDQRPSELKNPTSQYINAISILVNINHRQSRFRHQTRAADEAARRFLPDAGNDVRSCAADTKDHCMPLDEFSGARWLTLSSRTPILADLRATEAASVPRRRLQKRLEHSLTRYLLSSNRRWWS